MGHVRGHALPVKEAVVITSLWCGGQSYSKCYWVFHNLYSSVDYAFQLYLFTSYSYLPFNCLLCCLHSCMRTCLIASFTDVLM